MGQDSKTGGRGLYVETIEIDPEGGESVLFPCQAWSDEDDHTQQDIFPEPQVDQKESKFLLQDIMPPPPSMNFMYFCFCVFSQTLTIILLFALAT